MHVLLDHISAVIVAGVLFIVVFTLMHRNRQSAVEMQVNQMIYEQAYDFLKMIERDVENMRSSSQVVNSETSSTDPAKTKPESPVDATCLMDNKVVNSLRRTEIFKFPTLEVPVKTTLTPQQVSVTYVMEHDLNRRDSAWVNGQKVPLYSIYRLRQSSKSSPIDTTGTSGPIITNFSVTMYSRDGVETECADNGNLGRTQIEFQAASPITVENVNHDGVGKNAPSQNNHLLSRNNLNATRFGATIYSPNR